MTTTPLRRVAAVVAGQSPATDAVSDLRDGLPFIQGNAEFTDQYPRPRLQCDVAPKRAKKGDLLLSVRAPVGALNWSDQELGIGRGLAALRPSGDWDVRFLAYGIRARLADLRSMATGSTFEAVTADTVGALVLPAVNVSEQRRIADFLDDRVARIDQIITARRAQLAAVDARFAATRRSAVLGLNGPLRSTDLHWAEQVGTAWHVRRLSQIAGMGTGHTPSRSEPAYWVDCDIPWLTTSDVHRFRRDEIDTVRESEVQINAAGLANSAAVLHPAGTVALSRTASAGFSVVMDVDMATSQDFVTWTCGEDLRPDFLLHTLRVMRPYLLGYLSMGSTHKTIYFPDLMDLRAPVPTVSLQATAIREVQDAARERRSLTEALDKQVTLLLEYKQSLITAAVTGELDVTTAGSGVPG